MIARKVAKSNEFATKTFKSISPGLPPLNWHCCLTGVLQSPACLAFASGYIQIYISTPASCTQRTNLALLVRISRSNDRVKGAWPLYATSKIAISTFFTNDTAIYRTVSTLCIPWPPMRRLAELGVLSAHTRFSIEIPDRHSGLVPSIRCRIAIYQKRLDYYHELRNIHTSQTSKSCHEKRSCTGPSGADDT